MPSITAKYLGTVNPNMDSTKSVVEKNIIKVKASELSQWFQYNREKKEVDILLSYQTVLLSRSMKEFNEVKMNQGLCCKKRIKWMKFVIHY